MTHRRVHQVGVVLAMLSAMSCAGHGVAHVAPDESRPHISWEIRSGGSEGDRDFICGSAQPAKRCALAASTERDSTLAALHLSVHAAAQKTSYVGFMRAGFLAGDAPRKVGEVNVSINPGDRPLVRSVLGAVRSTAGEFELEISVDALQARQTTPITIAQRVPVTVK